MEKIIRILESFLGDSKRSLSTNGQLQFNCPACAMDKGIDSDDKHNLEVNINMGKYHCWVCSTTNSTKGKISNLIKKFGSHELLQQYYNEIRELKTNELYILNNFDDNENILTVEELLTLPKTFQKIDLINMPYKKVTNYLVRRGITQDIVNKFNIGFTNNKEENFLLRNRIIIPSYDSFGELNYWTGRDFTNNPKALKYWNTNINKQNIIFNEFNINWDADVILCEGPFDMISSLPNTIPLLGKTLSKDSLLYEALVNKVNGDIILYLDGDAYNNMKIIYKVLNKDRLFNKIKYVEMMGDNDPSIVLEKYGKRGVINLFKNNTKTFSEIDLLF